MNTDQEKPGPWFRGHAFTAGRMRVCAVCGREIKPGQSAIANWELRQVAHLGCGTLPDRRSKGR